MVGNIVSNTNCLILKSRFAYLTNVIECVAVHFIDTKIDTTYIGPDQ